jgi:UPF0716 protein FxsA
LGNRQRESGKTETLLRGALVLIVLAFPLVELWGIVELARAFGWWIVVWFLIAAVLGIAIIGQERSRMGPRMKAMLAGGETSLPRLLSIFRRLVAGILLVIPGVVSDVFALVLLLLPAPKEPIPDGPQIIEGEFRKVEPAGESKVDQRRGNPRA